MKADILNLEGKKIKSIDLPIQFNEEYRPDLIRRAVLTIQSNKRQPYGVMPGAGMRYSAKLSRRRRDYKTAYGHGISRAPRKTLWHRGSQFGWVGAFAPGTVGGRRAHPPKAEKIWIKKINKTKDILKILNNVGLKDEIFRVSERKVRGSRGKLRGRKYKTKVGPLIVVSGKCKLLETAKNILGLDAVEVKKLNAELLAPGSLAGRLTIFTEKLLKILEKKKLFM